MANNQDILGALGSIDFAAKEAAGGAAGAAPVSAARQHMEKKKEKAQEKVMFDLENFSMSASSSAANPLDTAARPGPPTEDLAGDALAQATSAWARERADFAMGRLASRAAAEDRAAGRGKQKGRQPSRKANEKKAKAAERGSNYQSVRQMSAQNLKKKKRMQKRRTIY